MKNKGDSDILPDKLFVGGIPSTLTSDELRSAFERFGKIKEAKVVNDKGTNSCRGFAFVSFYNQRIVDKILCSSQKNPIKIKNKIVECKKSYTKTKARFETFNEKKRKIFVGGLAHDTIKQDLNSFFSQYGQIEKCHVLIGPNNQKSRGFGFVVFECEESVKRCLEDADNHYIKKKWVDCKPSYMKDETTSKDDKVNKLSYDNKIQHIDELNDLDQKNISIENSEIVPREENFDLSNIESNYNKCKSTHTDDSIQSNNVTKYTSNCLNKVEINNFDMLERENKSSKNSDLFYDEMYQKNVSSTPANYNQYINHQYNYYQGQENNYQETCNQNYNQYYYNQEYPKYDTNQNSYSNCYDNNLGSSSYQYDYNAYPNNSYHQDNYTYSQNGYYWNNYGYNTQPQNRYYENTYIQNSLENFDKTYNIDYNYTYDYSKYPENEPKHKDNNFDNVQNKTPENFIDKSHNQNCYTFAELDQNINDGNISEKTFIQDSQKDDPSNFTKNYMDYTQDKNKSINQGLKQSFEDLSLVSIKNNQSEKKIRLNSKSDLSNINQKYSHSDNLTTSNPCQTSTSSKVQGIVQSKNTDNQETQANTNYQTEISNGQIKSPLSIRTRNYRKAGIKNIEDLNNKYNNDLWNNNNKKPLELQNKSHTPDKKYLKKALFSDNCDTDEDITEYCLDQLALLQNSNDNVDLAQNPQLNSTYDTKGEKCEPINKPKSRRKTRARTNIDNVKAILEEKYDDSKGSKNSKAGDSTQKLYEIDSNPQKNDKAQNIMRSLKKFCEEDAKKNPDNTKEVNKASKKESSISLIQKIGFQDNFDIPVSKVQIEIPTTSLEDLSSISDHSFMSIDDIKDSK